MDEAIAYVSSQRAGILQAVRARAAAARERNRADLQTLLQAAGLHENKGQASEARALYRDVLDAEPDWPDALHAVFCFLINQGTAASIRTTQADARREYEEAHRQAQRLTASDPGNTQWQRDLSVSYNKLGEVAVAQGQLAEAARVYGDSLAIAKKLVASDLSNTLWQRHLYVSHSKMAGLAERQKKPDQARGHWQQAFDVLSAIEKRGLHVSPEDREYLEILREKAHAK